jgi:hypothetical protein
MTLQYTLVGNEEGDQYLSVFVPGQKPQVADSTHPNFGSILEGVLAGDESVVSLFDVAATAGEKFQRLSERVTTANGRLYLDGEEVSNALAGQVVRFLGEGVDDWKPLVNFFENVQANPNEHSREQLYRWLEAKDFTITPDGWIVGYKSVQSDGNGGFNSISSGKAIVNGEVKTGRIPNPLGAVIEMPRSEVQHDPAVGCHTGLHVGTYDYAKTFSGDTMLEVWVNPRDVVSVPTECDAAKMRTCRYTVVDTIDKPYNSAVSYDHYSGGDSDTWGDGEGDGEASYGSFCENCGCDLYPDEDSLCDECEDKEEKDDLVGVTFRDNDPRRSGRTLTVRYMSDDGHHAYCTSSTTGKEVQVKLDRLLSSRYSRV